MRDVSSTGPSPSRRLVTVGALGVAVSALAGCGIRLEDDAPRVPLVPTRSPVDGEDALLRLLAALQSAAVAPVDPKAPLSPLLAALHEEQARVLHDALRQRGVPEDDLSSASPSPSVSPTSSTPSVSPSPVPSPSTSSSASASVPSSPTPSSTPSAPPPPPTLVAVERSVVTAGADCAAAETELRPTLLAILGQAHAALEIATLAPEPAPDVPPVWSTPSALSPLIAALRSDLYLLEVAAARSPQPARRTGLEVITRLERLTAELVAAAGDAAPAPELGRALPRRVTTPAEAATLAREAMSSLLGAFGTALAALGEADSEVAFAVVPRWLGTVAAQANRHGIPLTPFPGLA